jgi:peptide/nickel transport system substrate-binding protein
MKRVSLSAAVRLCAALTTVLVCAVLVGSASGMSQTTSGTVAVVGMEQNLPCLNPLVIRCSSFWTNSIVGVVLPGAYRQLPDYSYEPMLVDHVDVGTSPFSLTYHLKQQAQWSDGVPVTADDLIFTWQTITNPDYKNQVYAFGDYGQISSATKIDTKTVRFDFESVVPNWRSLFAVVLPQHVLAGRDFTTVWDDAINDPATGKPIGSGPFLVSDWTLGQALTLTRNPAWWGPRQANLAEIDFEVITDTNSELQAMSSGEVDAIHPSPQTALANLEMVPGVSMQSSEIDYTEHLDFNVASSMPLLQHRWFRQAVAYGIDRQAIVSALFGNIAPDLKPAQNLVYTSQRWEYQPSFAAYKPDLDQVESLMTGHGCTKGSDGIYVCGGTRASFAMSYATDNARRVTEFELMKNELAAAGIELRDDGHSTVDLFNNVLLSRSFDSIVFAWGGTGDAGAAASIYGCDGSQNFDGYCSQQVTSLLEQSNADLDPVDRAGLVNQAMSILATDVPSLPLYHMPDFLFYKPELHGLLENTSNQGPFWNAEDWRGATSTLTVHTDGSGLGTVSSEPGGIACGTTCTAEYPDSTSVLLTAAAASGSTFDGWSGDCSGTGSCTVTLAGSRSVTATFSKPSSGGGGGGGGSILPDVSVAVTAEQSEAPDVGGQIVWHLTVADRAGTQAASGVYADVTLPTGFTVTSTYADRGSGCTSGGPGLVCNLDWIDPANPGHVTIWGTVGQAGAQTLSAHVRHLYSEGNPADDTASLTLQPKQVYVPPWKPVIGKATIVPGAIAGKRVTVSFHVTQSDTGAPVTSGTMVCDPKVGGRVLRHLEHFKAGVASLTFKIPRSARGKLLHINLTIRAATGESSMRIATFRVR